MNLVLIQTTVIYIFGGLRNKFKYESTRFRVKI
jgi:hypothetical protein